MSGLIKLSKSDFESFNCSYTTLGSRSYEYYFFKLWSDSHSRMIVYTSDFKEFRIDLEVNYQSPDFALNPNHRVSYLTGVRSVNMNAAKLLKDFKSDIDAVLTHVSTSDAPTSLSHGGKRPGAGRKKGIETKLMRVPVEFEQDILFLIAKLKLEKGYNLTKSESQAL